MTTFRSFLNAIHRKGDMCDVLYSEMHLFKL